jgi:hypothetical protein
MNPNKKYLIRVGSILLILVGISLLVYANKVVLGVFLATMGYFLSYKND